VKLNSRGWSTGRQEVGSITFSITPLKPGSFLSAFNLSDRGEIESIGATILAPHAYEVDVRKELEKALMSRLPNIFATSKPSLTIQVEKSGHPKRLYLLLVAKSVNGHNLGRDWLFDQKITSLPDAMSRLVNRVVDELATEMEHGGTVDEYMRDQLVVFQALAKGQSKVEVGHSMDGKPIEASLHTKTAEWVTHELLDVEFDNQGGCNGIGHVVGETLQRKHGQDTTE
jgi:RNA 3'-terminal phosphate cyclase (ATP)